MSDEFLEQLDAAKKNKSPSFKQAIKLSQKQARDAAGHEEKGMHGRKKQLTTRIPEPVYQDLMERVKHFSDTLHMYQNDVQLWALLRGIEALEAGETPQLAKEIRKRPLKL